MRTVVDALGTELSIPTRRSSRYTAPGQFWTVGFDGTALAVVLVVAARGRSVLAWPVTASSSAASAPAFAWRVDNSEVIIWPEAEFGLSSAALDEYVGEGPESRTLRLVVDALEEREPLPIPQLPTRNDDASLGVLDAVCRQAWRLADLEWPRAVPGQVVLDPEVLEATGVEPTAIQKALQVAPGRVADLAEARGLLTESEVAAIQELLTRHNARHALVPAFGVDVDEMSSPRFKEPILRLVWSRDVEEATVRSEVLTRSRRAARQETGSEREQARSRLTHAIEELMSEQP